MNNTAYVYRHIRPDTNQIFYVGIAVNKGRITNSIERSKFWKKIVRKCNGIFKSEIMIQGLTWEQACEKEKEFIKLYGRRDRKTGPLVNFTDGGEGSYGRSPSESVRKKIAQSVKENSHWKDGRKHTPESLAKIAEAGRNREWTPERCKRNSESKKGIPKKVTEKMLAYWIRCKGDRAWCSRKVINTLTGETFPCIKNAAISIGMIPTTLSRKLAGLRKNNTPFKYL